MPGVAARRRLWPRALLIAGRIALGLIFVFAAYAKLHFNGSWHFGDYHLFLAIDSYQILPLWAVEGMARVLPWVELAVGVLLISGLALRWVGSFTSLLLFVFIGAMLRAQILGLQINCGCFGNNEKLGPLTLIRDGSLLVLALAVTVGAFALRKRRASVSS
jgi:uncharacterized membrane protein YphA (DoxX/SURF4 family)